MEQVKSLAQIWWQQGLTKISVFLTLTFIGAGLCTGNCLGGQYSLVRPVWGNSSLTLYKNMALVRDQTRIDINKDKAISILHPVSTKIIPQSAIVSLVDADVMEQSYFYRPVTPETLLESFVGRDILLINKNKMTGIEEIVSAKLVSAKNGVVLQMGNRIETSPPGRIAFPYIPTDLSNTPMLKIVLKGKSDKEIPVEVAYLTKGISWRADYVAVLDKAQKNMELTSWVTIKNHSGTCYKDASVQLVAGDVNEETGSQEISRNFFTKAASIPLKQEVGQEGLFEYHLYSIKHRLSVKDSEMKQVCLFSASPVPYKKGFLVKAGDYPLSRRVGEREEKLPVQVMISFKNDNSSCLGIPMPQGDFRVYKRDSKGLLQFIGKDHINHVAKGENVKLNLGKAFDLLCTRTQTDFKKFAGNNKYNSVYESSYKISLKNTKKEPVSIIFQERLSGNWQITKESLRHIKLNAALIAWTIEVPPGEEKTLTFTIRTLY